MKNQNPPCAREYPSGNAARKRSSSLAFTLIELLVVIGIIVILAALAFPFFGQVRASANATRCVSNLKQIFSAAALYAEDNDGYIPPSRIGGSATQYWPWLLSAQMGQNYTSSVPYRLDTPFVCQSAYKMGGYCLYANGSGLGMLSTYSVNIGISASSINTNWQGVRRKFAGLPRPSLTSFYIDGSGLTFSYSYYSPFVYPHNGKMNVLFCDGHVDALTKDQIPTNSADVFFNGDVVTYYP